MKKIIWAIISIPLILAAFYWAVLFYTHDFDASFLRIDACLDRGGCWDKIDRTCRQTETNAQVLCDRSKSPEQPTFTSNEELKGVEKKIPTH